MNTNEKTFTRKLKKSRTAKLQKDGFTPMESAIMLTILRAEKTAVIDERMTARIEQIKNNR